MGYKIFEKLIKRRVAKQDRFYIKAARGADASAIKTSEGVVVLKGSIVADSEVASMQAGFKNKRRKLIETGIIKDLKFTKDYLFSSPSTAASVVMGRTANGLSEWKKEDGSSLRDNQATDS